MTTNTTKQTIDVEVPEGWEAVRHGVPLKGEHFISRDNCACEAKADFNGKHIIIRKKKPIRRVFELVSDDPRQAEDGEFYITHGSDLRLNKSGGRSAGTYSYIWREIKGEGDD